MGVSYFSVDPQVPVSGSTNELDVSLTELLEEMTIQDAPPDVDME